MILGKVGIVIDSDWFQAESSTPEDEDAAETKRQFVVCLRVELLVVMPWTMLPSVLIFITF